jgi:hypothetical protein
MTYSLLLYSLDVFSQEPRESGESAWLFPLAELITLQKHKLFPLV